MRCILPSRRSVGDHAGANLRAFAHPEQATSRRGFSLVELLVVFGVVMILIGLMMPSIARVRTEARGIVCQSEMRQLSTMILAYTSDHKDSIPFPLTRLSDGLWTMSGGSQWTAVRAVAATNYWPVAMFDEFNRSMYADILLCPQDQHTLEERALMAAELGVDEQDVQAPAPRTLSSALYLDWQALKQDLVRWDDRFLRIARLHDVRFASQKSLLIESEPYHEPGYAHVVSSEGFYISPLPDPDRYRLMIAAVDGSARLQHTADAQHGVNVPGYFREYLAHAGLTESEIALNLRQMQVPTYFHWTRNGVEGRDW